jgi:hypothetical protein
VRQAPQLDARYILSSQENFRCSGPFVLICGERYVKRILSASGGCSIVACWKGGGPDDPA